MKQFLKRTRELLVAIVTLASLGVVLPAHADLSIPAGGSFNLAGGSVDLGCSDVIVGGTLDLAGGHLTNVRNVSIQSGGTITLGTAGAVSLAGNWSNAGSFDPGTGTVSFVDAPVCAPTSTVSGNTNFYSLSLVSSLGKLYKFTSGSTQRVLNALTLTGISGQPLRIESTTPGVLATIEMIGATQVTAFLAVRDMGATGQVIALGLTNLAPGTITPRWFEIPVVPTLSTAMLVLMMLALIGLTAQFRRRRAHKVSQGMTR
jgi:hypothetical protein